MEYKYYAYELWDPREEDFPFYVGKGSGKRMFVHEWAANGNGNHIFNKGLYDKIEEIKFEGLSIGYVQIFCRSENEAFETEKFLIAYYGLDNLCNINEGGRCPKVSDVSKIKMSLFQSGHPYTKEQAEKVRQARIKNGHTKLTPNDVNDIRACYASGNINQTKLAKKYGVSQLMISKIVNYKKWKF